MADLKVLADHISETIAAIAALGTSAYGLVDTTKIFWNGISRVGYGRIERTLQPFAPALENAMGRNWANAVFSYWLNGVALDEQKAKTKSLIRLGLTPGNAEQLANAGIRDTTSRFDPAPRNHKETTGVIDPAAFTATVGKLYRGEDLVQTDINLLGRFDATVDAALDAAYERADREYKNAARSLAALFAAALAVVGGYLITRSWSEYFIPAVVVGLIAIPLAPIAKDLSTALANAVGAMNKVTGRKP